MRRIVQYPPSTHYSEINISPQWHQWLRHTRYDPPSLTEQSQDLIRQENLKVLAAQADARWAAKTSFLDKPGGVRGQPVPALEMDSGPKLENGKRKREREREREGEGVARSAVGGVEDTSSTTGANSGEAQGAKETREEDGARPHPNEWFEQNKTHKLSKKKEKDDPWKQARGGPREEWQPQAWDGNMAAPKRR